ncbi:unnamed protein product [Scytosiphon promiscuus]
MGNLGRSSRAHSVTAYFRLVEDFILRTGAQPRREAVHHTIVGLEFRVYACDMLAVGKCCVDHLSRVFGRAIPRSRMVCSIPVDISGREYMCRSPLRVSDDPRALEYFSCLWNTAASILITGSSLWRARYSAPPRIRPIVWMGGSISLGKAL